MPDSKKENKKFLGGEKEYFVPPDGGWGWLVALGALVTTILVPFFVQVFSLLNSKIFKDNRASTSTIAWIFNLSQSAHYLTCIFLPILCEKFGFRKVTICGGLLVAASFVTTSLVEDVQMLFLTYSVVYGVGSGLGLNCWNLITSLYFEKRRGRVLGVLACGLCSGQFVAPLLVKSLQNYFGHKGTLLIMGAIALNVCVSGALYQPVEWHAKRVLSQKETNTEDEITECNNPEEKKNWLQHRPPFKRERNVSVGGESIQSLVVSSLMSLPSCSMDIIPPVSVDCNNELGNTTNENKNISTESLTNCCDKLSDFFSQIVSVISQLRLLRVACFVTSISLTILFYINMLMFIPLSVADKGFPMEVAAYTLSVLGIANVAIRIIVSSLTDWIKLSPRWYYMFGCLTITSSIFVLSFANEKAHVYASVAFYGIGIGSCVGIFVPIIIEIVGVKLLPSVIGTMGLMSLILSPIIGPVIGYVRDATQDYCFCLRLIAILQLLPFSLCAVLPLATKFDKKRERIKEKNPFLN